eukprot:sb/3462449/
MSEREGRDCSEPVDKAKAGFQWDRLQSVFKNHGLEPLTCDPIPGAVDMVFAANSAIVLNNKALISNMAAEPRKPEEGAFESWYREMGFEVATFNDIAKPYTFCEGNAEFSPMADLSRFFFGWGQRTAESAYEPILYYFSLDREDVFKVRLIDGSSSQLIEVTENEAMAFTCNCVSFTSPTSGQAVVVSPNFSPRLRNILESLGYVCERVDFDQFLLSGGAVRGVNHVQSDPDLTGPDLPEPRFTGRKNFPQFRKLTVYHPDILGTPIYRAKPFPPSIPVNRGPTVVKIPNTIKISNRKKKQNNDKTTTKTIRLKTLAAVPDFNCMHITPITHGYDEEKEDTTEGHGKEASSGKGVPHTSCQCFILTSLFIFSLPGWMPKASTRMPFCFAKRHKVGFFEVVTPLLSRGVVFARDSPHLLSLFGKKPDITGKSIILGVRKTLQIGNYFKRDPDLNFQESQVKSFETHFISDFIRAIRLTFDMRCRSLARAFSTPPYKDMDSTERVSLLTEKKEPCGPAWKCLPLSEVAQIIPPFFMAGFGTLAAGLLLDEVQNWRVFQAIGELFVLVPALLGLKGNLAMTLASRLSTQGNTGARIGDLGLSCSRPGTSTDSRTASFNDSSCHSEMLIRWLSIVFFTTITLLGITGNSLIIYSSARYNAINLDEVSVKFVRNLAVGDLLYTVVGILPPCISSIMDADPSLNPFRVYMWLCKTCYFAKHVAGLGHFVTDFSLILIL